jgi:hypothetical protein
MALVANIVHGTFLPYLARITAHLIGRVVRWNGCYWVAEFNLQVPEFRQELVRERCVIFDALARHAVEIIFPGLRRLILRTAAAWRSLTGTE